MSEEEPGDEKSESRRPQLRRNDIGKRRNRLILSVEILYFRYYLEVIPIHLFSTRKPDMRIITPASLLTGLGLLATLLISPAQAGWVMQNSGTTHNLNDVTANHGHIDFAWACGDHGTILYTSNGGQTWQEQASGTTADLHSLAFIEITLGPVMAVGDSGVILMTLDSGTTWERQTSPTSETLRCLSDDGRYIVGDQGTVLFKQQFSDPWTNLPSPTTQRLNTVSSFFTPVLIAGDSGFVMRKPGIQPWEICSTGTTANLFGIPMFSVGNLIVGDSGLVLRSSNFGQHWFRQDAPAVEKLRAVEFSVNNTSRIYVVGDGGTILKSADEGVSWTRQESGTPQDLHGVFFYLDDNNGYAVGDSGTILRTWDGGALSADGVPESRFAPEAISLSQNYPNPFNPTTTISFELAHASRISLKVFDVQGREVAVLRYGLQPAGAHSVKFQAGSLGSGVYFYRLTAGEHSAVRKMLLMK